MFNIIYRLYFYPIPRPSPPYIPSPLSLYLIARQGIGKNVVFQREMFSKGQNGQFGHRHNLDMEGDRSSSRRGVLAINARSDTGDIVRVKPFQMTTDTTFFDADRFALRV